MNDKKKPAAQKIMPEHTIRCGNTIATIHQRSSHTGYVYWDYSLSRTWRSRSTTNDLFGDSFFIDNQDDLVEVIGKACEWIRNKVLSPDAAASAHNSSEAAE